MKVSDDIKEYIGIMCQHNYNRKIRGYKTNTTEFVKTILTECKGTISTRSVYRLIATFKKENQEKYYVDPVDVDECDSDDEAADRNCFEQRTPTAQAMFDEMCGITKVNKETPQLLTSAFVQNLYLSTGQSFVDHFLLLTTRFMFDELQRNCKKYTMRQIRNHLKTLGAKIKHVRFRLRIIKDRNPFRSLITYTTSPPTIEYNNLIPTHPEHEFQYFLWLHQEDKGDILVWDGVKVRTQPMSSKWKRRHKSWNCFYELKGDDSYHIYPEYYGRQPKVIFNAFTDEARHYVSHKQRPTFYKVCALISIDVIIINEIFSLTSGETRYVDVA